MMGMRDELTVSEGSDDDRGTFRNNKRRGTWQDKNLQD
jgi:hypothetical protein